MSGSNVTAVSVPATVHRVATASKRAGDRSYLALLLALSALVMGTLAVLHDHYVLLAGDEPNYLIISQALQLYHSIDVQRVYDAANYHAFYPWPLPPHIAHGPDGQSLPWHGIGGPVLWLLPFILAGRAGVTAFMIVVSLLIVANVFLLARALGVGPRTAFAVGLTFAIGTPILTYSCLVFVEPIGALGCVYALRLLHTPTLRTRDLLLVSTCLGVLPWVHARFLLFPPLFLAFLLLRLRRDDATRLRVLAALTPALLLIAGFEVFNLIVWHTLSPAPNQISIGAVPFQKNPLPGLIGTVMDPGIGVIPNFPIFLLVLPGILLTAGRRWWPLHIQIAALVLPYTLIVCTFTSGTVGGRRPPGSPPSSCPCSPPTLRWLCSVPRCSSCADSRSRRRSTPPHSPPWPSSPPTAASPPEPPSTPGSRPCSPPGQPQPSGPPQPDGCSAGDSNTARTTRPRPPEPSQPATRRHAGTTVMTATASQPPYRRRL
jgi:hypothetical protein